MYNQINNLRQQAGESPVFFAFARTKHDCLPLLTTMKYPIIQGIYKITNPKKKVYVGQSKNIYKRWRTYKKLECEQQRKLYNSFVKYGVDKHKFEILHQCTTVEEANELEKYYIQLYQCFDSEHGLNLKGGGDCGGSPSKETRAAIAKANMPYIKFGKNNVSARAVYVYDLSGKCLGRYDTMTDAAKDRGIPQNRISDIPSCCAGRRKSVNGYQFKYANEVDGGDIEPYQKKDMTGANNPSFNKTGDKSHHARKLNQLNQETREIIKTWGSSIDASRSLNISNTSIANCLFRKGKGAGGFGWEYAEDKKTTPINQLTKDGEFIKEWASTAEASRTLGITTGNIWSCCNNRRSFAGDFKWEYKSSNTNKNGN